MQLRLALNNHLGLVEASSGVASRRRVGVAIAAAENGHHNHPITR